MHPHMCVDKRIPFFRYHSIMVIYETETFIGLEPTKYAGLVGQWVPRICVSPCLLALGLWVHATMPSFFLLFKQNRKPWILSQTRVPMVAKYCIHQIGSALWAPLQKKMLSEAWSSVLSCEPGWKSNGQLVSTPVQCLNSEILLPAVIYCDRKAQHTILHPGDRPSGVFEK